MKKKNGVRFIKKVKIKEALYAENQMEQDL